MENAEGNDDRLEKSYGEGEVGFCDGGGGGNEGVEG